MLTVWNLSLGPARHSTQAQATRRWQHAGPMGDRTVSKDRTAVLLQASEQGRRLYQHHGFKEIDTVEFNLSEYGLYGTENMTEMIRGSWSEISPEHEGSLRPG